MADDDKELKDQRVVTMMSPSEVEAIDDWMFENRIRSRGEAIRRLCQVGVALDRRMMDWSNETFRDSKVLLDFNDKVTDLAKNDAVDEEAFRQAVAEREKLTWATIVRGLQHATKAIMIASSPKTVKTPEEALKITAMLEGYLNDLKSDNPESMKELGYLLDKMMKAAEAKDK